MTTDTTRRTITEQETRDCMLRIAERFPDRRNDDSGSNNNIYFTTEGPCCLVGHVFDCLDIPGAPFLAAGNEEWVLEIFPSTEPKVMNDQSLDRVLPWLHQTQALDFEPEVQRLLQDAQDEADQDHQWDYSVSRALEDEDEA